MGLLKESCQEKQADGTLKGSNTRIIMYAFALCVIAVSIIGTVKGTVDYALIAELIGSILTFGGFSLTQKNITVGNLKPSNDNKGNAGQPN